MAVTAKGDMLDSVAMPKHRCLHRRLMIGCEPEPGCAVETSGYDKSPVRAEPDTAHDFIVVKIGQNAFVGIYIPDPRLVILAGSGDGLVVWTEGDEVDPIRMRQWFTQLGSSCGIPNSDCEITAASRNELSTMAEGGKKNGFGVTRQLEPGLRTRNLPHPRKVIRATCHNQGVVRTKTRAQRPERVHQAPHLTAITGLPHASGVVFARGDYKTSVGIKRSTCQSGILAKFRCNWLAGAGVKDLCAPPPFYPQSPPAIPAQTNVVDRLGIKPHLGNFRALVD